MNKLCYLIGMFFICGVHSIKANMSCGYTSSKSGITIKLAESCSCNCQPFLDSLVNQLSLKINRQDTTNEILVLVNWEFLRYDFSDTTLYFISLGLDTLRETDSDFINNYCHEKYDNSEQSRSNPVDINFTDKMTSNKIGVKIIYKDLRSDSLNWSDIEKLISFSAINFNKIKNEQKRDTVVLMSWYISLPTLNATRINEILGKAQNNSIGIFTSNFLIITIAVVLSLLILLLIKFKRRPTEHETKTE
jgi:hypothetical protein